jgi:hypothetical protein
VNEAAYQQKEYSCKHAKVKQERALPAGHPRVREGFASSTEIQIAPSRSARSEGGEIADQ